MNDSVKLVIIDDDVSNLAYLRSALDTEETDVAVYSDPDAGLRAILNSHPDIALIDLMMPGLNGMDVLKRVMSHDPSIEVIMITGCYSCETAVAAIKQGASDYLVKPVRLATLRERIDAIIARSSNKRRACRLSTSPDNRPAFEGMFGQSPRMWDLFSMIQRVAPHYRAALITGETGTGKELVARAMHHLSPHHSGQLVAVNCSSVVETLFESELFGHVKGAFTGATHEKTGLIEHAHNGTLFLDEIGDMPLPLQAKLLRVLQENEVQRLGSLVARKVNVKVLAATHRDLRQAIQEKRFREDLFYRLSMIELEVPRLVDREGDIPLLTHEFLTMFAARFGKPIHRITQRAQLLLERHTWPGNVRELENAIGHACILSTGNQIDIEDLPTYLHRPDRAAAHEPDAARPTVVTIGEMPSLEGQERSLVIEALTKAGGNQAKAARLLGISRDVLRYRMKKHSIRL